MKEKKGHDVKLLNDVADEVKYRVYENDEQKSYNVLQKNVAKDQGTVKTVRAYDIAFRKEVKKLEDKNYMKNLQAINHKKEEQSNLREARQDLDEKWKSRDAQVSKRRTINAQ